MRLDSARGACARRRYILSTKITATGSSLKRTQEALFDPCEVLSKSGLDRFEG